MPTDEIKLNLFDISSLMIHQRSLLTKQLNERVSEEILTLTIRSFQRDFQNKIKYLFFDTYR
jgi:hypothetical protein